MINHHERPAEAAPGWTAQRIDRLVQLWRTRASAAKIAQSLGGGVTRSAVVGKLYRLGLTRDAEGRRDTRAGGARYSQDKQGRPRKAQPAFPIDPPPPPDRPCPVVPLLIALEHLQAGHCRWPYEFAGEAAFCGHRVRDESPYCPDHHRRAYVAVLAPLTLEQVRARTFTPLGDLG